MSRSLLLIHGGALGDFVLSVVLARELSARLGLAQIRALCRSRVACFLAQHGWLAGWKSLENPAFCGLFTPDAELAPAQAAWIAEAGAVLSMVGPPGGTVHCKAGALCSAVYSVDPGLRPETAAAGRHIVQQWLTDLAAQGTPLGAALGGAAAFAESRAAAIRMAGGAPPGAPARAGQRSGEVLIHPGSGSPEKCWPLESFLELAAGLQSRGQRVRFMIGPAEQERWSRGNLQRLAGAAAVLDEPDICAAAEPLMSAAGFIGNDSGVTHLAGWLGLPTVAIFTSTAPAVWSPIGADVTILERPSVGDVLCVRGLTEQ
jgi:hypothetical protein